MSETITTTYVPAFLFVILTILIVIAFVLGVYYIVRWFKRRSK